MKKKVLALVLALVLCFAMTAPVSAAEVVIFEQTENGSLSADAIATMQANPDATLVLEYKTGSDAGKAGWGLGGICYAGWSVDPDFEVKQSATDTVEKAEWKVSDVLAKGTEININLYNDATPVRCYLNTADAVAETTEGAVDESPKTGDSAPIMLICGLLAVAVCGFVIVTRKKAHAE